MSVHKDIWNLALGYMDSRILFTATELGVFDVLTGEGGTAPEVAEHTDISENAARRLLTALAALELVEKDEAGRFVNAPETDEKLVRGRPGYVGSMFQHLQDRSYPVWSHFTEALKEERAQWHRLADGEEAPNEQMFDDPEALRTFIEGMHPITYRAATDLAWQADELAEVDHIVDLGGASGAFVIALAERFPGLRGTVFDLPPVEPITTDFFDQASMNGRLDFHAGDFWNDPLPAGADAYALGFILHDWHRHSGSILLDKVAEASRTGGMLIIGEYLLDDDRTGPLHVARQDLNMLVAARGRERTAEEYAEWIQEHGFEMDRIVSTSDGKQFMIARYRG